LPASGTATACSRKYLWSLGTLSLEPTLAERHAFWTRVAEVLAPYAPAQRNPVVATLAARIPPPTPEQMHAEQRVAETARVQVEVKRIVDEIAHWDEIALSTRSVPRHPGDDRRPATAGAPRARAGGSGGGAGGAGGAETIRAANGG
jgi:hypothetical protein